ncbi:MAG: hypothetical protein IJS99_06960 [Synergistaceae bacterium]|nr:hypothetical protein [Synergistaceae bacterium]
MMLIFLLGSCLPACAKSLLYTFSSGDIIATNPSQTPTYGVGRIDFDEGEPVQTILISNDTKQHSLGEFTRNGLRYIYDSRVQKPDENTTYYDVYNASIDITRPIASNMTLTITPNPITSCDLTLAPDSEGYIYAIHDNTLTRYDLLNWDNKVTQTLESGYNAYSLVGLTNNVNYVYVWASQRENISGDNYTPAKSDIYIYNRETLAKVADFHFVRTGLDVTKKRVDDEANGIEVGRGLVDINNTEDDKAVVLVVYDTVSSDSPQIIRIDEAASPVNYSVIVNSSEINGWDIDIESPIPDEKGGFYFGCYSGDANAEPGGNTSKDCALYHWNKTKNLTRANITNAQTTADLVVKAGQHAGKIVAFVYTGESYVITNNQKLYRIDTYLWDGINNTSIMIDNGRMVATELEKPFTDGSDGLYFMMEMLILSYDADSLCHWNPSNGFKIVDYSAMELEIENPPLDGGNGFYYVKSAVNRTPVSIDKINSSVDIGMVSVDIKLYHCTGWVKSPDLVCDLGLFDAPANAYEGASGDFFMVRELLQSEHGFLEDSEHELFFVGAGPVGGRFAMRVFEWDDTIRKNLTLENLVKTFKDDDLGGYVDVTTAVFFEENYPLYYISSSGCNSGIFGILALTGLILLAKKRRKREIFTKLNFYGRWLIFRNCRPFL